MVYVQPIRSVWQATNRTSGTSQDLELIMKKTAGLFLTLLIAATLNAQTTRDTMNHPYWIEMMQNPGQNFFQTQRAFELYWQNRPIEKSSGYKPFKRWEFSVFPLVQPNGSIMDAGQVYREIEREWKMRQGQQMVTLGAACFSNGAWEELGPVYQPGNRTSQPNGLGRVNALAFHPSDSNQIWAGAPAGGLWHSLDGGKTWITYTDTLATLGVSSIAIHPQRPDTIYIGTGDRDASDSYGLGVFVSYDGGKNWQQHNTGMGNRTVGRLLIDENNPDVLLAATNAGIYRSVNGGNNWSQTISGNFKELVFKPGNSQVLYASQGRFFYRSTNNGQNFSQITSGIPTSGARGAIAVTPADTNFVYFILCNQRNFNSLNLSTDGGASFTTMSTTPNIMDYSHLGSGTGGQAWYDLDMAADPSDKSVIYVGGVNVFRSADRGRTWKINAHWVGTGAPAVHADHHIMEYNPHTGALYSGHDGGVHRTHDQGKTWVDLSKDLGIAQIYRLSQGAKNPDMVINGYQDNGTGMMIGGQWFTVMGGDGMDCEINPQDATWAYSDLYYGDVRRYKNGYYNGTIAKQGVNGINEQGAWITPFILQEGNASTMFVGYKNIWRSNNVDTTSANLVKWTKISNNLAGSNSQNVLHLENSPADPERLYMSRYDNKLFRTDNAGAASPTWINLTSSLPVNNDVMWIESHPRKKDEVFISLGNRVYRSTNAGSSWTNYSNGLPNIPVMSLVFDSSSKLQGVYAGTYGGVYYRDTTMSSWLYFSDGMPLQSRVRDLDIYYHPTDRSKSHVVAATYGRGNWKSPLYDEEQEAPIAGVRPESMQICRAEVLRLFDTSAKYPTEYEWIIQPNTFSFVQGTDSSSKDVAIQFNQKGSYTVTHIVRNCWGEDTLQLPQTIAVGDPVRPAFCAGSTITVGNYGIGIHEFELNGQAYASSTASSEGGYIDAACTKVFRLKSDTAYWTEIKTGPSYDESVRVYIDFNDNGRFTDPGEMVLESAKKRVDHADSIRIPQVVVFNTILRMRVMSDYDNLLLSKGPCDSVKYGQIEDYGVIIEPQKAWPRFVWDRDSLCPGELVTFTDSSEGVIASWLWDFGPNASKDTAMSQGSHTLSFNQSGWQRVSLSLNGDTTLVMDSAVYVKPLPVLSYVQGGKDTSVCEDETISFQVSTSGFNLQGEWMQDGMRTNITSSQLLLNQTQLSDSGAYYYRANANGCRDSLQAFRLRVHPTPEVQLLADSIKQCAKNQQFGLRLRHQLQGPGISEYLYFGDGNGIADTLGNPQYNSSGIYQAKGVVRTPQGCADSAEISLEVLAHPQASLLLNSSDEQCEKGNAFALEDRSVFSGSMLIRWESGDGRGLSGSPLQLQYATSGNYQLLLIAESADGCSDTAEQLLVVHPNPQLLVDVNQTEQCFKGHAFNITDQSIIASGNMQNPEWDLGDGNTATGLQINAYQYAQPGLYTLTLERESDEGCRDTAVLQLQVHPNPQAGFSVNDSAQCFNGHSFEFINQTQISSGAIANHQWDFGDGNSSTQIDPAPVQYADSLSYGVQLITESDEGCADTFSRLVRVWPSPQAIFSGGEICLGEWFVFTSNIQSGSNLEWDCGDGTSSSQNPYRHHYKQSGSYDVKMRVVNAYGCSDSLMIPAGLVVNPVPMARFQLERLSSFGLQTTYQTVNQSTSAQSFLWDFGNGSQSASENSDFTYNDTGQYLVRLIAMNDFDCSDTAYQWLSASPEAVVLGVNAFSPNNDGLNDGFRIHGIEVALEYELRIFNRWGEVLFLTSNPQESWDGTYKGSPVQEGYYFYMLKGVGLDGEAFHSSGRIQLMR